MKRAAAKAAVPKFFMQPLLGRQGKFVQAHSSCANSASALVFVSQPMLRRCADDIFGIVQMLTD